METLIRRLCRLDCCAEPDEMDKLGLRAGRKFTQVMGAACEHGLQGGQVS